MVRSISLMPNPPPVLGAVANNDKSPSVGRLSRARSLDRADRLKTGSVGRFGRAEPSTPHCDNVIFRMKS
jgi:hypothetical protein